LLIHSAGAGSRVIGALGRAARVDGTVKGVPARALPLEVWHTASIGIDLWLAAIAYGASQVWVLMTDEEAPDYRAAVAEQMAVAQAIVSGLGLLGHPLRIVDAAGLAVIRHRQARADRRGRWRRPLAEVARAQKCAFPIRRCSPSIALCRRSPRSACLGRPRSACRPTSEPPSTWRSSTCCRHPRARRHQLRCLRAAARSAL
jgi:hypothetical protein